MFVLSIEEQRFRGHFSVIVSVLVIIGVNLLLENPEAKRLIVVVCVLPLVVHLVFLFIYFLYFTTIELFKRSTTNSFTGLQLWIQSHHQISIFRNAFYFVFTLMIFIGFVGLAVSSTVFFSNEIRQNNRTFYGETLLTQRSDFVSTPMKACHWKFRSLNIQDLILLAALAYRYETNNQRSRIRESHHSFVNIFRPTEDLKLELNRFFSNQSDLQFDFDEEFSHFKHYGYGDVTFFTVT